MGKSDEHSRAWPDAEFDGSAAQVLTEFGSLLLKQRRTLRRILLRVYEIAEQETALERAWTSAGYLQRLSTRRPKNVQFIDGARGSGKTTLLLTIRNCLRYLGRPEKWLDRIDHAAPEVQADLALLQEITGEIRKALPATPKPTLFGGVLRQDFSLRHAHIVDQSDRRRTACFLPVLFPSDLEGGQSIMEGVFALMSQKLNEDIQKRIKVDPGIDLGRDPGHLLQKRLYEEVTKGWYLSKGEGAEAILRDSFNYVDFLDSRGRSSVESFNRVQAWREYVVEYLRHFNAALLVVFFDDTDATPQVTSDILHTTRIFLDHPRIVTVVTGNLRSMRDSLRWRGPFARSQDDIGERGAEVGHRSDERSRDLLVEEYLEKVLPRPSRHFISLSSKSGGNSTETPRYHNDDVERILGVSFDQYCEERLASGRNHFLARKLLVHLRELEDREPITSDSEHAAMENHLAWWLFRYSYRTRLAPLTARQLHVLRAYTKDDPASPYPSERIRSDHLKRLAVILFEDPKNFELIRQFTDKDTRVVEWLHEQQIRACWREDRHFEVNGKRLYEGTYSYSFLMFRIDLDIAMPLKNARDNIPLALLPVPDGPNLIGMRRFFGDQLEQRLHGVAGSIGHSLVPANCIYFDDLESLPDIAWRSGPANQSIWGNELIYRWPSVFFFAFDEFKSRDSLATQNELNLNSSLRDQAFVRNDTVEQYLQDVVIPLASLDIGLFVPSIRLQDASAQVDDERVPTLFELEKEHSWYKAVLPRIDALRRQFDYFASLASGPAGKESIAQIAQSRATAWHDEFVRALLSKSARKGKDVDKISWGDALSLRHALSSYLWLMNDIRRAAHAARVFLNQIPSPGLSVGYVTQLAAAKRSLDRGSEEIEKAPKARRKDQFQRNHKYTAITFATVDRWLRRSDAVSNLFDTLSAKFERDHRDYLSKPELLRRDLMAELAEGWQNKLLRLQSSRRPTRSRVSPIRADQVLAVLPIHNDEHIRSATASNPTGVRPILALEPAKPEFRMWIRLTRALSLFVWALAPCLPSLIHLEVSSAAYAAAKRTTKQKQAAVPTGSEILTKWAEFVSQLQRLSIRVRTQLELMKLRMDIAWVVGGNDVLAGHFDFVNDASMGMSLAPDMSFTTQGARGLADFHDLIDGIDGEDAKGRLKALLDGERDRRNDATVRFKSVFEDLESLLENTSKFIDAQRDLLRKRERQPTG